MNLSLTHAVLPLFILTVFSVKGQDAANSSKASSADEAGKGAANSHYTLGPKSRDGIGKFYMGREIAYVMGHLAADWLERPEREREERPSLLMKNLELKPDAVVADIGAGSGYFTFRLAEKVPDGKVLAVDIQPEMIALVEEKKKTLDVKNIETILGEEDDTKLPEAAVDAILLVDAYHEFSYPHEMLASMFSALKPGGRVFLLEYRGEDRLVPIKPLHKMTQAQAKKEYAASGFKWVETRDFLPWQHYMIFEKPGKPAETPSEKETSPEKSNSETSKTP